MTEHLCAGRCAPAARSDEGKPDLERPVGRMKLRRDFLAANAGIRVPMPPFVLLVKQTDRGEARAGFTVSKKVGNSVVRNRARRRLREAARMTMPELGIASADHVFIARAQAREPSFDELLAHTRKALAKARSRLEGGR